MENEADHSNTSGKNLKVLAGAVVFIFIVVVGQGYLASTHAENIQPGSALFGDSYGWVNALFSGLAFAVLIYAILTQQVELKLHRAELELQRQELKQTRQVLSDQKNTLELQRSEMSAQRIDDRFFSSIPTLARLLDNFDHPSNRLEPGRLNFTDLCDRILTNRSPVDGANPPGMSFSDGAHNQNELEQIYAGHLHNYLSAIRPILKTAEAIVSLIDSTESKESQDLYSRFLNAQFDESQRLLLWVHCSFAPEYLKSANLNDLPKMLRRLHFFDDLNSEKISANTEVITQQFDEVSREN